MPAIVSRPVGRAEHAAHWGSGRANKLISADSKFAELADQLLAIGLAVAPQAVVNALLSENTYRQQNCNGCRIETLPITNFRIAIDS